VVVHAEFERLLNSSDSWIRDAAARLALMDRREELRAREMQVAA
jgi:hypothetical protein